MQTIDAGENHRCGVSVSFSAIKLLQKYHKQSDNDTCPFEAPWAAGVEGHYKGCKTTINQFRGNAKEIGVSAVNTLAKYMTKLIYFDNTNSTIITTSCTAILNALSKCMYLNDSGLNIIYQFEKVFLAIVEDFSKVIEALSAHIGELARYLTAAVNDLGGEFSKYMKEFLESCELFECKKEINYECVRTKLQKLMNTVALIDETLLNRCESEATPEVYEAVMVLNLLYFYLANAVQGINSCALDVLYDRECLVSQDSRSNSLAFDYALTGIAQAVWDVTVPFEGSLVELLTVFVKITMAVNTAVKDNYGVFEGVETTIGEIEKNLLKRNPTTEADDRTNILNGVFP